MDSQTVRSENIRACFSAGEMTLKDSITGAAVSFSGGEEFVLYVQDEGAEKPFFSADMRRKFVRISASEAEMRFSGQGFSVRVRYRAESDRLVKKIFVEESGGRIVKRMTCEGRQCNLPLSRGGEGQPVFAGGCMWCGIEFPAANNGYTDRTLSFMQAPFRAAPVESFDIVYAFKRGESLERSFLRYIEGKPREKLKIYCDWGLHDDLSDNVELTQKMTEDNIGNLASLMESSGVHFDYYLMDAYWFEEHQPYIRFKERTFPGGIDAIIERLEGMGIHFGLWFDLNCIHAHLQGMEKFDTQLGNGSLCFACDEIAEMMFEAIKYHVLNHKVRLIKLDFAYFECKNPGHGHSTDFVESKERSICNFIRMTQRLKELNSELKIICYNGWTTELDWIGSVKERRGFAVSPYWCRWVDYVYCGDPRPSEIACRNLEDSIVYYTDAMIRNFHDALMPFSVIDDHGTMLGDTSTIYRLGKAMLCCGWLMNAMRGGGKLHLYGRIDQLDGADSAYMRKIADVFDDMADGDFETSLILGDARKGEVYGYSASQGERGYAVVLNPSARPACFALSLPEWERSRIQTERIVECGELAGGKKEIFSCLTGELPAYGYRLIGWRRLPQKERGGRLVLEAHSKLALPFEGGGIALCFEKGGAPLKSARGYPEGLSVTAGGKSLLPNVVQDIWSGISWLYFPACGEKEALLEYDGGENIVVRYRLEES